MVESVNVSDQLMNYTESINIFNCRDDYEYKNWKFDKISGHRKSPYGNWEVKVIRNTGEEIWYTMQTIIEYDKLTLDA